MAVGMGSIAHADVVAHDYDDVGPLLPCGRGAASNRTAAILGKYRVRRHACEQKAHGKRDNKLQWGNAVSHQCVSLIRVVVVNSSTGCR